MLWILSLWQQTTATTCLTVLHWCRIHFQQQISIPSWVRRFSTDSSQKKTWGYVWLGKMEGLLVLHSWLSRALFLPIDQAQWVKTFLKTWNFYGSHNADPYSLLHTAWCRTVCLNSTGNPSTHRRSQKKSCGQENDDKGTNTTKSCGQKFEDKGIQEACTISDSTHWNRNRSSWQCNPLQHPATSLHHNKDFFTNVLWHMKRKPCLLHIKLPYINIWSSKHHQI